MRESNGELPSPPLSEYLDLSQFLFETDGPSLDELLDHDDHQSSPCEDEDELLKAISDNIMSPDLEELLSIHCLGKVDFSFPQPEFVDEMATNKKILSSEEILKLAAARFMRTSTNGGFDHADHFESRALQAEEQRGMEVVHLLFTSAELISNKKYDQAARLLSQCKNLSSDFGNPLERVAYYFSEALQERIERESMGGIKKEPKPAPNFAYSILGECDEHQHNALMAFCFQVIPYSKVMQFTLAQAIIDSVGNAKRIHVIDLGIRTGSQWILLIQYLAGRAASSSSSSSSPSSPLELLTITAVGMNADELRNAGRRLSEFAESLRVPFLYKIVKISNLEEIKDGLLKVKPGESVAVSCPLVLRTLLYDPLLLVKLMNVIKKLKPMIIVNEEVEQHNNSLSFLDRFVEALFSATAFFDWLDIVWPNRKDINRVRLEGICVGNLIMNIIACEGKDRFVRHVKTDVWRCLFRHAGFEEMQFSYKAWYQARLLLNQFPHGDCYTFEPNGFAIVVGWKGTPMLALSAWTYNPEIHTVDCPLDQ